MFRWTLLDEDGRRVYRGPGSDKPVESTDSRLYTTIAPPGALLGTLRTSTSTVLGLLRSSNPLEESSSGGGRRERRGSRATDHEYFVDPSRLKISLAAPSIRRPSHSGPIRTRRGR